MAKRGDVPMGLVLHAQHARREQPSSCFAYEDPRLAGHPFKCVWARMEQAVDLGFIDYGVSLRTGWLSDKGMRAMMTGAWR